MARHKSLLAAALGLALLVAATCALLGNLWLLTPMRNTRYAPGYSEQAFRAVAVGDSETRVSLSLLGEPLLRTATAGACPEGGATGGPCSHLWYARPMNPDQGYLWRRVTIQAGHVVRTGRGLWWD
ncbi:MAG TPA: hypothetical protein PLJ35_08870 [Anaerolineae bacterium]|nr:hypothetical protein [Anaerolineae bacterium]HOQ98920.1 hypothetical protein [Anaerolineae bacterium]HPL26516.1 hypothetical protein [Anaerolineae bacterium]